MKKLFFMFFVLFLFILGLSSCTNRQNPGVPTFPTSTPVTSPTVVPTKGWVDLGTGTFTPTGASWTSIAGSGATLYVAYIDSADGYTKAMKYSNNSWTSMGTISAGAADRTAIYVDNGNVYVAYVDTLNGSAISAKEYTGGSWQALGSQGFTPGSAVIWQQSLRVNNGVVYVTFRDNSASGSGREALMKYSGGAWSNAGGYITSDATWYTNGVVDPVSNTIYSICQASTYGIESQSIPAAASS